MTPHFPIYMDYGATTNPVRPARGRCDGALAARALRQPGLAQPCLGLGGRSEAVEKRARGQVAALVGADPREIVWTSGATESINLALKGAAHFYKTRAASTS